MPGGAPAHEQLSHGTDTAIQPHHSKRAKTSLLNATEISVDRLQHPLERYIEMSFEVDLPRGHITNTIAFNDSVQVIWESGVNCHIDIYLKCKTGTGVLSKPTQPDQTGRLGITP